MPAEVEFQDWAFNVGFFNALHKPLKHKGDQVFSSKKELSCCVGNGLKDSGTCIQIEFFNILWAISFEDQLFYV